MLDTLAPASFESEKSAHDWASTASAPNAFFAGLTGISIADLSTQEEGSSCPTVTETGSSKTYQGGCTTPKGKVWFGTATSSGSMFTGGGTIAYDSFGYTDMEACKDDMKPTKAAYHGKVTMGGASGSVSFTVNIKLEVSGPNDDTCSNEDETIAIDYAGSSKDGTEDVDKDGDPDADTWNGSGRMGSTLRGVADVTTTNELINDVVCQDEAVSGTTAISANGNTLLITYDGAADCEKDSTVQWSLNGTPKGELKGIRCSVGQHGDPGALLLLAFALLLLRMRTGSTHSRR